jgi:tetratricopeptide (TPR) repeat protein
MDDLFGRYQAALRNGHQLAAEGKFKDALRNYEEAARVAGERALPHVCVGGMQLRLGRAREALAAYDRALAVAPDDLDALGGRAAALLAAGRRAEAAAVQQHLAALRDGPAPIPEAPAGLRTPFSRAETLAIAGERARDAGNVPGAVAAWLEEAREHAAAESYDAAVDAALRALSLDTAAARVHLDLARIYAQRGWQDLARDHAAALRRFLDLSPDDAVSPEVEALQAELLEREQASTPPAQP